MRKINIRSYVTLAMFAALSYASLFVMRISGVGGFLTFDIKDALITIAAMLFGPLPGVAISLLVAFIEMLTVSGTGPWGFLMNFVSSAVFAASASLIYRYTPKIRKTLSGAIVGLTASVVLMTAVMLLMNLLITPVYYHIPVEQVKEMLVPLLLPFNLIKAVMNSAIVLVLYKPLSTTLKKTGAIRGSADKYCFDRTSIILTVAGVLIIVACTVIFLTLMNGTFQPIKQ